MKFAQNAASPRVSIAVSYEVLYCCVVGFVSSSAALCECATLGTLGGLGRAPCGVYSCLSLGYILVLRHVLPAIRSMYLVWAVFPIRTYYTGSALRFDCARERTYSYVALYSFISPYTAVVVHLTW